MRLTNFNVDPKKLIFELRSNNLDGIIRTTKQWIHKMDRRQCESEFILLQNSLRHIHKNADRSKDFHFGPTVMRMLHFLNLPERALQVTKLHALKIAARIECGLFFCRSTTIFNSRKCFNSWAVWWFCVICYSIMECTRKRCRWSKGDVMNNWKKAWPHLDTWIIYCLHAATNW